jgi:hypothetical protein
VRGKNRGSQMGRVRMVVPGFSDNLETIWIVRRALRPAAATAPLIEERVFADLIEARADVMRATVETISTELLECTLDPGTGHVVAAKLLFERLWIDLSSSGEF